ncbi:MAG: DUF721 domain-containing protein [Leptolyngbyaceae cyanobacterium SM2_5_2]|nr:DUF721 domain-containing protein [Leptolyngbyaceae cyanobacterium SM2_5_2]
MPLDAIGRVIHQLEQQPNWRSRGVFRRILERWPEMVGAVVARQTRPVRLNRQVLYVAVANPMWAQTLTLERLTILTKLNHHLQIDLEDLRFSSGDWFRHPTSTLPLGAMAPQIVPDWLRQHPSFEPGAIPSIAPPTQRLSPQESFQRWAALAQGFACSSGPSVQIVAAPAHRGNWSAGRAVACARLSGFSQTRARRSQ